MRLYLVRHGIAVDDARVDASRSLTNKGRKRLRKTARALRERIDLILTSPLVRAVQSAEILAAEVKHGEVLVLEELTPEHPVEALLRAVAKVAGKRPSVALVGHDPQLTLLLSALAHVPAVKLDFRKGAIVRLDLSGLPQPKTVAARYWLKPRSGAKRKGLPLKKAEPKRAAKPAARMSKRRAASPAPRKKVSAATKYAAPAAETAAKPAAPPQRQTFMGSPRAGDAIPAPPEVRPPEGGGAV
jgi:phosphohistidine phosphatase